VGKNQIYLIDPPRFAVAFYRTATCRAPSSQSLPLAFVNNFTLPAFLREFCDVHHRAQRGKVALRLFQQFDPAIGYEPGHRNHHV